MRVTRQGIAAGLAFVLGAVLLAPPSPARSQEYTVAPGDVLQISVIGESEVSGPATVSPDGKITLPLAGEVPAAGLTLPQLTEKITTALKAFIRDPQVQISIRQAATNRQFVYLLGQVVRPGAYEMQKGWTLAELMAMAGGATSGAALTKALILRKQSTISTDLEELLVKGNASANVTLEPGDVVMVPETQNRVVIMGEVLKPGPYLFKAGDRVVDVLSAAGGLTPNAAVKNIGVIRQAGAKPTVTPINLDKFYKEGDQKQNVALETGDVVYVPTKSEGFNWSRILSMLNGFATLFLLFK